MRLRNKVSFAKRKFAKQLRRNMTMPERILWHRLKDKQIGTRIYPQSIILGFIVDFWCPCGIVIEVDGKCHDTRKGYDAYRDFVLKQKGIKTLRFTAQEVINNCPAVVALIGYHLTRRKNEIARNKLMGRSGWGQK